MACGVVGLIFIERFPDQLRILGLSCISRRGVVITGVSKGIVFEADGAGTLRIGCVLHTGDEGHVCRDIRNDRRRVITRFGACEKLFVGNAALIRR